MAFSGRVARGSAVEITADTAIGMSPTAAIVVGRIAIVCVATKNIATTDGATNTHLTVTGTAGNTWTKLGEYTETAAGAADDGSTVSLWVTKVTTQIEMTDVITATLSGSIADKCIACMEAIASEGVALEQLGVGQNAMAATVTGMPSREYLFIGGGAAVGTDNAKTPDADYVEYGDLRSRNVATAITSHLQARIATLTADTVTSTGWTGTQPITLLAALYEVQGVTTATIASGSTLTAPTVALEGGAQAITGATRASTAALTAPTVAHAGAGPLISSVSATTDTLTISGSGFGSHADFGGSEPFLNAGWHDFETNAFEGGNLDLDGNYDYQWSLQTSGNRTNSTRHARKVYVDNRGGEYGLTMSGTTGTVFVSFWFKTSGTNADGKFFRVWGNEFNIYLSTGNTDTMIRGFSECTVCSPAPTTVWGSPDSFGDGSWHRVDVQMRDNSSGSDYFGVYLDGVLQWQRGSNLSGAEDQEWVNSPFGGNGHTLGVGGMLEDAGSFAFDDVYVDYTWARVELGNASTFAASTVREVQPPTSWSASSITAQLNRGGFSSGQTVYLYVVDANGSVNAEGYPVVSSGSDQFISLP